MHHTNEESFQSKGGASNMELEIVMNTRRILQAEHWGSVVTEKELCVFLRQEYRLSSSR